MVVAADARSDLIPLATGENGLYRICRDRLVNPVMQGVHCIDPLDVIRDDSRVLGLGAPEIGIHM